MSASNNQTNFLVLTSEDSKPFVPNVERVTFDKVTATSPSATPKSAVVEDDEEEVIPDITMQHIRADSTSSEASRLL